MQKLRNILNNLYQDANAMESFDPTIANFTINNALTLVKTLYERKLLELETQNAGLNQAVQIRGKMIGKANLEIARLQKGIFDSGNEILCKTRLEKLEAEIKQLKAEILGRIKGEG